MPTFTFKVDSENEIRLDYQESQVVQVERCDFTSKIGSVKRTDEGYLRGEAPVAKVGIMKYVMSDGSIISELVPAETLFNEDSMKSLELKPITNAHPKEILLDRQTVKRRKVGSTGELVKKDADYLVTSLIITDDDGVSAVEDGRQELSPGYICSLLMQPGTFEGVKYDAIQIERRYNHVAICDKARGGSDIRLNLDNVDVAKIDGFDLKPSTNNNKKEKVMPQINLKGINYDAAQEVINYVQELQSQLDSIETKRAALESEKTLAQQSLDSISAERDTFKEEIETLKKQDNSEDIHKAVKARLSLLKVANATLDEETVKNVDEMSDSDIRKAVILAKQPNAQLDGKSEDYLTARFDSVVESIDFDADAIVSQRRDATFRRDGKSTDTVEKAKQDSEEKIKTAYQNLPDQY